MKTFKKYGVNHTCYGNIVTTDGKWQCIVCGQIYTARNEDWPNCFILEEPLFENDLSLKCPVCGAKETNQLGLPELAGYVGGWVTCSKCKAKFVILANLNEIKKKKKVAR